VESYEGTKVGVVSDTHDEIIDWDDFQPAVAKALAGVDLILHCGHLTTTRVLDRLAEIAPVVATRTAEDPPAGADPRLTDGPRTVRVGDEAITVLFELPDGYSPPEGVRVVAYGSTHAGVVEERDGVLYVNGGSPSLSKAKSVAIIDLSGERPTAAVVSL